MNSFIDNLNIVNNAMIRATAKLQDLVNALQMENNQHDSSFKRNNKNLNRLADSFSNKENEIIKDLDIANKHLILVNNDLLNQNPIIKQGDFATKQRLINSIETSSQTTSNKTNESIKK